MWDEMDRLAIEWHEIVRSELTPNMGDEISGDLGPELELVRTSDYNRATKAEGERRAEAWQYIHRRLREVLVAASNKQRPHVRHKSWQAWGRM